MKGLLGELWFECVGSWEASRCTFGSVFGFNFACFIYHSDHS